MAQVDKEAGRRDLRRSAGHGMEGAITREENNMRLEGR
jgi:hypothetical protein